MRKKPKKLKVDRILKEFQKSEQSSSHRRDAFKIEGDFEDAVRKIAGAKPKPKGR